MKAEESVLNSGQQCPVDVGPEHPLREVKLLKSSAKESDSLVIVAQWSEADE